jgi:predicted transcriptional regulator
MAVVRTISVKLNDGIRERLKRLANAKERTVHWIMREAIEKYLEREEQREALWQEALASQQECQKTGLHVAGDEVDA